MQNKFHCCYGSEFFLYSFLHRAKLSSITEVQKLHITWDFRNLFTAPWADVRTHTWVTEVSSAGVCCYVHSWAEEGFNLLSQGLECPSALLNWHQMRGSTWAKNWFLNKVIEKEYAVKLGFITSNCWAEANTQFPSPKNVISYHVSFYILI